MGHARESITVVIRTRTRTRTRTRIALVSDSDDEDEDEDERRCARGGARRPARVGRRSRGRRGVMVVPSEGRISGQEELCCHTMTFETLYSLRLLPPVSPMGSIA